MIIDCGYKKDDFCNCYNKIINNNDNVCTNCPNITEVYTEKDKRRLLYKSFRDANKEESYRDVMLMRAIYGHSSLLKDDFDSIYYSGYSIWLLFHKKHKNLCDRDILNAFYNVQFMNMRIPKRIRREARRVILKCEREHPWWYQSKTKQFRR